MKDKNTLLNETYELAAQFVDDFNHLQKMLITPEQDAGDIRRNSGLIRQYLIDGKLKQIANPRIGRINLLMPDNEEYYNWTIEKDIDYFISGGASIFGITILKFCLSKGIIPNVTNPKKTIKVDIDVFRKQKIICYVGKWITRDKIIRYICHKAGGIHYDITKRLDHEIRARSAFVISKQSDGSPLLDMKTSGFYRELRLEIKNDKIDPFLYEILSTVYWLDQSPDVHRLIEYINQNEIKK
jgi:hypothetical protein